MATELSNIDDLLTNQRAPSIPPISEDMGNIEPESLPQDDILDTNEDYDNEEENISEEESSQEQKDTDEYGNKKGAQRTYTEEEVNEKINKTVRERLERERKALRDTTPQQQQKYDESDEEWKQQFKHLVRETVQNMTQEQQQAAIAAREQEAQAVFEQKFQNGMSKFPDYVDVVGRQPINDAMVIATREMKDPAAFLYAASKRAPQELERISKIRDPYAQIAAMGALEISLKKVQPGTKAPKPMSRTIEDAQIPHKSTKKETIEDLIRKDQERRLSLINSRRRN
jgi:hypothetical protein